MTLQSELTQKTDALSLQILTIDKVFADGSSTVTHLGRNDSVIRTGLSVVSRPIDTVLILGSGCYEPWTTAGQERIRGKNAQIICIDRSPGITETNKKIKTTGTASLQEIASLSGNPVFGNEELQNSTELLKAARIEGVSTDDERLNVEKRNRDNVKIEAADALIYIKDHLPNSADFVFAGNLENNLIFQEGYSFASAVAFHRDIARIMKDSGIYTFSTNEMFFNDLTPGSVRNVLQVLDEAGLEVLYKATQHIHVLDRPGQRIMTENCGIITAKKGSYEALPDAKSRIEATRKEFTDRFSKTNIVEGEGTLEDYRKSIGLSQTNLVLIKIGSNKYYWFNISGSYYDVCTALATTYDGFYPRLFLDTNT